MYGVYGKSKNSLLSREIIHEISIEFEYLTFGQRKYITKYCKNKVIEWCTHVLLNFSEENKNKS